MSTFSRTGVLSAAAILLLAGLAIWAWRGRGTDAPGGGPIVIISVDTLRADRLPAYGYSLTATPHIDRLAADGVLFENAYSHSPQTLPSHMSILSGELPFEHGVRDNIGFSAKPGQRSLPQALAGHGYATGAFVSSYVLRRQTGVAQGFEHYDDALPPASPDAPLGLVQRAGADTMAAAVRWIDRQPSPKFLLFAHIYEPHTPYSPPARFAGHPYDGEVAYADEIVGTLLEHLRTKNLYENATVILLSDHGEGLGDHGEDEHGLFLYRETIQVPLIIKLPRGTGAGRRVADPVQHIDLLPTLLDLADVPALASLRGRSLVPLLESSGPLPEAQIYSESLSPRYHFGWSELYALSVDRYRYIRAPRDELYDVSRDPGELASIAGDRPQLREGMRRAIDAIIATAGVTAPSAVSEEDRRKLAALGYVGAAAAAPVDRPGDAFADPKDKIDILRKYRRAARMAGAGQYADAIALFRELLRDEPGLADVRLKLAESYEQTGRFEEALAEYQQAIARNAKDAAALTGAAGALMRLGRLDDARAHADLAVDLAPAVAQELLARIEVQRGDVEAARRHARLASEADPSLPMTLFVEGLISHRGGSYAEAARQLLAAKEALATRTQQLGDLNFFAADALARLERYDEAEPLFNAELALFPTHTRARAGLAMLYRATGRNAQAEQAIDVLLRLSPTPEGYETAAQLWTMFGEPRRAAAVRARAARGPG